MSGGSFDTLSLSQFLRSCDQLYQRVANGHGRIEITADDRQDGCVLISKAELESLERALEILSQTSEYQSMCQTVASLAAVSSEASAIQPA